MIEFLCTQSDCRNPLNADESQSGSAILCPECGGESYVPSTSEVESVYEVVSNVETVVTVAWAEETTPDGDEKLHSLNAFLDRKRGRREAFVRQGEIAHGGMGTVLITTHLAIRRPMAVKLMLPEIADSRPHRLRFLEEAQVTGQLEHPNIVPVHELGKDAEGRLYFSMKLVKGKSLAELIDDVKSGKPDAADLQVLLGVFLKICDGVSFAHSRGVIHRDLKPDNIMIGDFGEVLVMDWGLGKVVGEDESKGKKLKAKKKKAKSETVGSIRADSKVSQTRVGAVTGTPAYMSPEQAEGEIQNLSHRSDIYSLGAILYEILSLRRAVEGKTVHEILLNVTEGDIVPPEKRTPELRVPPELSAIAMKCLEKNRWRRYPSAKALAGDIRLFLAGRGVTARTDSFGRSILKLIQRNLKVSLTIGASILALLMLTGLFTLRLSRQRRISEQNAIVARSALGAAKSADASRGITERATARELAIQAVQAARDGFLQEAVIRTEAVQKLSPDGPWAPYALGMIAFERGQFDVARGWFHKANSVGKGMKMAFKALLEVDEKQQDIQRNIQRLNQSKDTERDWESMEKLGDHLYERKKYQEALTAWQRSVALMEGVKQVRISRIDYVKGKMRRANAWIHCEGFYESIKDLEAREQIEAISGKLIEIHTNVSQVRVQYEIKRGVLTSLRLSGVGYLQPLLNVRLDLLELNQSDLLEDLSPLRGIPLRELVIRNASNLTDLGPLSGMPLRALHVENTSIWDLKPLKGMPLKKLSLWGSKKVEDLKPIANLPLESLNVGQTKVFDLLPITDMKLKHLFLDNQERLWDWQKLKNMPFVELDLMKTGIDDLTWLEGKKIQKLVTPPLDKLNSESFKVLFDLYRQGCELKSSNVKDDFNISDLKGTKLNNLALLHDLNFETLDLEESSVSDLTPLKKIRLPLIRLNLKKTSVTSLDGLQGYPIQDLDISGLDISDLTPLKGMPLQSLKMSGTKVKDLSPLKGAPLSYLEAQQTPIQRLEPLKGMPLIHLNIAETEVTDLRPLEGIHIASLNLSALDIQHFGDLASLELTNLNLSGSTIAKLEVLSDLKLDSLNLNAAILVKDLSPLRDIPLRALSLAFTGINDLKHLQGMELTDLDISNSKIADLTPLQGMPLRSLILNLCPVASLAPLRGMPLETISLENTEVADLTPLIGTDSLKKLVVPDLKNLTESSVEFLKRLERQGTKVEYPRNR